MKTLIIYASMHGSTRDCAKMIQEKIGENADSYSITKADKIDLSNYDNVVIGSYIAAGGINAKLKKWVKNNLQILLKKNIHIFVCSGDERESYIAKNFDRKLLNIAKQKTFFGGRMKKSDLPGFVKFIISMIGKEIDFNTIKNNVIEDFAKNI